MAKKEMPRLGRGLAALLGEQATELVKVSRPGDERDHQAGGVLPIEQLEPSPFQPRQEMDEGRLAELADSIRSRGVLQPILVRPHPEAPGRFQIIAGERRWRASQLAGLHEVPVHVRTLDDADAMAAALVENLQRADLNAIEEAEGLQRLMSDYALTQEELAGAVGKSRPHIANTLRLLNLPPPVRGLLRDGKLTAGHARALLGHPEAVALARLVVERGLSVRQTEALAQKAPGPEARAAHVPRDAEIVRLERELAAKLGLRVQIRFDGKGGSIRLDYRSLDQFDGLLRLLDPDMR
ncbi:ParB/RepB/Spo0J family partition protein [Acidomonas methanolica]|uniref:Chromosome partitioning nuclease protein ParB n=1 Tax=Acidomonas methanolica NBRC 104435 TaxID=1231351 RepID=A0A023D1W8_ACIMT|nr:ParB/RepB/Spo0J family partition protein [Acidomonas methanolica]MBU2654038.1 ParB/RepB/Spo0J family partition protein [Acidomonas methanolica]TCS30732.1 ParB family chromosome partitioning protein [Acidomonas methanolica]GAJ28138.1 chromosome partitioning nuclease protein ParB [Acidomonas methanolica NBRC 104435]GBQ58859.1 chromosome partitioning protein ParB [Acidomonas methanolica]GEK98881.1 chromosome partitioning protein ParB [Acidomonas methanolica NBRC 104435]